MSRQIACVATLYLFLWFGGAVGAEASLPDGSHYAGEMANGMLHGQGVLVWPNGNRYDGAFKDGLMHGRGLFTTAAGDRYEGELADGAFHGRGVHVLADGSRYEGQFEQGYASGQGRFEWADGTSYEGEFRYGSPFGEGRLVRADGTTYQGQVEHGWEHGQGTMVFPGGLRLSGRFERGELVEGRWDDGSGAVYEGEFSDWQFAGQGSYTDGDGTYRGTFEDGYLTAGIHESSDGSRYAGEFLGWMYHGEGRLETADGKVLDGQFESGEFSGPRRGFLDSMLEGLADFLGVASMQPAEVDPQEALIEQALYLQPRLIEAALQGLAPERPDRIDLYAVQVAGYGGQDVFRREAEYARDLFVREFGAGDRVVTLANSRTSVERWPMATRESLRRTLTAVAARMNPEQDILFLYMTSHGSEQHEFQIDQEGMELPDLHATELAAMLDALGLRYKVVVVSACYSGGFIPYLRDDHTLIMTAASANRASFGCSDENDFTYFGRALLEDGIGAAEDFVSAFELAAKRVSEQETAQDLEPSQPQIHREASVEAQLRAWRAQRASPLIAETRH